MLFFSTYFDHNYLSRGLVLYESLKEYCSSDFILYILATDDIAFEWLKNTKLEKVIVNSLEDLKSEYPVLNRLQKERSRSEFSWTLSSFSIQFFIKKYNLEAITYLDADLCFYDDPKFLFDELKTESVIITPHNYTPYYDQSATSGRYCVQFMYFKNNDDGNKVLEWWRAACEECCCGTPTDGKFGDQKYLDDWLSRFPGIVHEETHMGCGIAPWNIQQFDIIKENDKFIIINKITKLKEKMIFYHFHGVKEGVNNNKFIWNLNCSYEMQKDFIELLYKPYTKRLEEYVKEVPERQYSEIELPLQKLTNLKLILKTGKRTILKFLTSINFIKTMREVRTEFFENQKTQNFIIN